MPKLSLRFSLREHDCNPVTYHPDIRFLKPSASILRIDSYEGTAAHWGNGYAFIIAPREWLNGKYIRWIWNGYFSYVGDRVVAQAIIYDGEYDRSNDADFPSQAGILLKGAGLLQTLYQENTHGAWGPFTRDVLVDVSGGTEDKCTVFFIMIDSWEGQTVYLDIDWVEINTGAGGSGTLYDEQFTADVVMERTGTYGDYGYISTGIIPMFWKVTVAEKLGMVDAVVPKTAYHVTAAEKLGMLDGVAKKKAMYVAVAETLGLLDSVAKKAAFKKTVAEKLGLLDAVEKAKGIHVTVAEKLGFKDRVYWTLNPLEVWKSLEKLKRLEDIEGD